MTNIKNLEEKNEKLQTEIEQINSKNKQLIENFKSKIWYHTMLSENDFLLRKLAKNWVKLGKIPKIEVEEKMDVPSYLPADFFSNIKFEDMLSDFGVRAAFLEDSLLKSSKGSVRIRSN